MVKSISILNSDYTWPVNIENSLCNWKMYTISGIQKKIEQKAMLFIHVHSTGVTRTRASLVHTSHVVPFMAIPSYRAARGRPQTLDRERSDRFQRNSYRPWHWNTAVSSWNLYSCSHVCFVSNIQQYEYRMGCVCWRLQLRLQRRIVLYWIFPSATIANWCLLARVLRRFIMVS